MKNNILHVKNRISMYVPSITYQNVCSLINGIFLGSDFNFEFNYWLFKRYKIPRNIAWDASVLHFLAKEDEQLAIDKLFEVLIAFLDERGYPPISSKSYSLNGVSAPVP